MSTVIRDDHVKGDLPDWLRENLEKGATEPLTEEQDAFWRNRASMLSSRLGQGLPGIISVSFDPDGSMPRDEEGGEQIPPHDMVVSWDTAYSYRTTRKTVGSMGVGHLHAYAIAVLAATLSEGVTLSWMNEFSGEVYSGARNEDLATLVQGGEHASLWLEKDVLPLIEKKFGSSTVSR